jgi:hypothetical protein
MRVPGLSRLDHGVELDEQFPHAGYESDFGWFARLPQMLVEADFGNLVWPTSAVCSGPPFGTLMLRVLGSAGA